MVFTTSQVLLDKISKLVAYSYYLTGGPAIEPPMQTDYKVGSKQFRDHGIVNVPFLQQFTTHYRTTDSIFTPQQLLDILSNQLVFAPFIGEDYFMPCVLSQLPMENVSEHRLSSGVSPLLIYFPGAVFPTGLFSALVAFLLDRSAWTVAERHGDPICLHKNCVMLKNSDFPINLTLIYSLHYIEIHIKVQQEFNLSGLYLSVRTTLFLGLDRAAKIQGLDNLHPQVGFPCPCGEPSICSLCIC